VLGLSAACVVVGGSGAGDCFLFCFKFCERLLVFGTVIALLSSLLGGVGGVFSFFVDQRVALLWGGLFGYMHSMESLILAQDERWRRA
jgi:hypothetical protein